MLSDMIEDYIIHGNSIITSSSNNGATSLLLYISNILLREDRTIVFYDPFSGIDKHFVKKYYPRVYEDVIFFNGSIVNLIDFLEHIDYKIDTLVIDPADPFVSNKKFLSNMISNLNKNKSNVLCSSQIRQDPSQGGKVYSTVEELNKIYNCFHFSIWLRNTSGKTMIFNTKYVDVFRESRSGNKYIARYIAKFVENEGYIIG